MVTTCKSASAEAAKSSCGVGCFGSVGRGFPSFWAKLRPRAPSTTKEAPRAKLPPSPEYNQHSRPMPVGGGMTGQTGQSSPVAEELEGGTNQPEGMKKDPLSAYLSATEKGSCGNSSGWRFKSLPKKPKIRWGIRHCFSHCRRRAPNLKGGYDVTSRTCRTTHQ